VEISPALACGNAFISSPRSALRRCPLRLAALLVEPGAAGVLNVSTATREAVRHMSHDAESKHRSSWGREASPVHLCDRLRPRKARAMLGGDKNHMIVMPRRDIDQAVDAMIGADMAPPASAAWRLGRVPRGQKKTRISDREC